MPKAIQITPVLNGWVVSCGCQTLVFNSATQLATEFTQWLENPQEVERRYEKLMLVKGLVDAPPPEPMAMTAREAAPFECGAAIQPPAQARPRDLR